LSSLYSLTFQNTKLSKLVYISRHMERDVFCSDSVNIDRPVAIATGYWEDGWGSILARDKIFSAL
jgi:hypothetical protein